MKKSKAGNKKGKRKPKTYEGILKTASNVFSSAAKKVFETGAGISKWSNERISQNYSLLLRTLKSSKELSVPASRAILNNIRLGYESVAKSGKNVMDQTTILINALLATDFSKNMETWLGNMFNEGIPSVYDKAADAVYNATSIGGGQLHRLFDGSHTVWGMWDKVRDALPNDTFLQEVVGYSTALGKDLSSTVGIPLFDWSKSSYDQVAGVLNTTFDIPRTWFSDLLHVNVTELIGTSIGTIAIALNWNKKQVKEFASLAGSLGISSIASANPALAVVTLVTLAKSYMDAKEKGNYSDFVNGLAKGGVGTGVFLATASGIGGPVWVGILAGVCIGAVVHKSMDTVEITDIAKFANESLKKAAAQLKGNYKVQPATS